MMKRGIVIFALISTTLPFISAHAMYAAPYINVTVEENSVDSDAVFNFKYSAAAGLYIIDEKQFQIETQDGWGTYFKSIDGPITHVYLTQDSIAGFTDPSVSCVSSNPLISATPIAGGVLINAQTYSSVTCTFTNIKKNSKTPVLIVPGILGTELQNGNTLLWSDIERMAHDVGDSFMDSLALKSDLSSTDGNVSVKSVITSKDFSFIKFDYTRGLINTFVAQGYTENKDLFTFPYDWRYGVSEGNVTALKQKIAEIMTATGVNKVDVIAHSTGGLLVKKYVMDNPNEHHLDKVVFVGVPNLGAPKAVKVLLSGDSFNIPFLADSEIKKISENMPVAYDLLPSQKYFDIAGSFVRLLIRDAQNSLQAKDLNYDESKNFLLTDHGMNATAYGNAQNLHTVAFDSYDMRTAGVDMYNIVGCKSGTMGTFFENKAGVSNMTGNSFQPELIAGDSTVPQLSATAVPAADNHTVFVAKTAHANLLSANGSRQEIVNFIAGTNLATTSNVWMKTDVDAKPERCAISGHWWEIFSPLSIEVTDALGNRAGIAADGSIQNDIPGADYEVFGDHKFVFVPTDEGQTYTTALAGTGSGTFTLKANDIDNGEVARTEVFTDIPVTPDTRGSLGSSAGATVLSLDTNNDGVIEQTLAPTSVLSGEQSHDVLPPITTATISGSQGKQGFYRSDVSIALTAFNPVVVGHETETSGVLKTEYQMDGGAWLPCAAACSVSFTTDGFHTISFYSEDTAGNTEAIQTRSFILDKTAPELSVQFSPALKDLVFSGSDAISTTSVGVVVLDKDSVVTATDEAGNATKLEFADRNRKITLKADIKTLSYNGVLSDISKTKLQFLWLFDKKGNLALLTQNVQSKNGFNVSAGYALNTTLIAGRDQAGKFSKAFSGLKLLNVKTHKGDFGWGY